jgi:hypothetical protein
MFRVEPRLQSRGYSMSGFFDEKRLSEHLLIPRRTLQRWRATGDGPAFIRAGERRILYRAEAVDEWAKAREHRHRAAEMVAQKNAAA